MNYDLPHIPVRASKPRQEGLNMIMDKGLSIREAENMLESAGHLIDLVKLGFGTSLVTNNLKEKIDFYNKNGIITYFGGTLFEAFLVRNMLDEFKKYVDKFGVETIEVSDGSMYIDHDEKLKLIAELNKDYRVLSEVGSKQKGVFLPIDTWISQMKSELEAGSWKVIAESRESGTVGIYNADGSANETMIKAISEHVDNSKIIWEAPDGKQQVWFIKIYGSNVNLGNIAVNGIIPLETLRIGVRGDTFFDFLPEELKKGRTQTEHLSQPLIDFQI
jgi:phosphosulfolactate synthase